MSATTTEFRIEGMSCGHCVKAVTTALKQVPGVTDAKVEVGKAVVTADASVKREVLAEAIVEAGYQVVGTGAATG